MREGPEASDLPSSVSADLSFFDRFASATSTFVSRAWFFALCVLLILVWAPTYFAIGSIDSWQLIINTATTIVTFLLVALLQNSQRRAEEAIQHKLNAVADGLADLMEAVAMGADARTGENSRLRKDIDELRASVGIERRESS
jgi:low affinity Fe/Cu permease